MLQPQLLQRIQALGSNISQIKGESLFEQLSTITFNSVLYLKPTDTPWANTDEEEPIYGLAEFIDQYSTLITTNQEMLYQKIIEHFYQLTDEPHGQLFWEPTLFTPFLEGSDDFIEWNDLFVDVSEVNLQKIIEHTKTTTPAMIQLFTSYGYPSHYYCCLEDPHTDNPTLFGTDHTEFFQDISNEGSLLEFLNRCMTPTELISIVKKALDPS